MAAADVIMETPLDPIPSTSTRIASAGTQTVPIETLEVITEDEEGTVGARRTVLRGSEKVLENRFWRLCIEIAANFYDQYFNTFAHVLGLSIAITLKAYGVMWSLPILVVPIVMSIVNILWLFMCMGVIDGLVLVIVEIITGLAELMLFTVITIRSGTQGSLMVAIVVYLVIICLKLMVNTMSMFGWYHMEQIDYDLVKLDADSSGFVNRLVRSNAAYNVVRDLHRNYKISEQVFARSLVHPLKTKSTSRHVRQHSLEMVRWAPLVLMAFNHRYIRKILAEAKELSNGKHIDLTNAILNQDGGDVNTTEATVLPPMDEAEARDFMVAQQLDRELNGPPADSHGEVPSEIFEPTPSCSISHDETEGLASGEAQQTKSKMKVLKIKAMVHGEPKTRHPLESSDSSSQKTELNPQKEQTQSLIKTSTTKTKRTSVSDSEQSMNKDAKRRKSSDALGSSERTTSLPLKPENVMYGPRELPISSSDPTGLAHSPEVIISFQGSQKETTVTQRSTSRTPTPEVPETATDSVSTSSDAARNESPVSMETEATSDSLRSSPKEQTVNAS